MALNPPLSPDHGAPISGPGELFLPGVLNIDFQVESGSGYPGSSSNYYGTGTLFLSQFRIVFVNARRVPLFHAFALPLQGIAGERLNQPVFGANNITGRVAPVERGGLRGPGQWKLTFKSGGAASFMTTLVQKLHDMRTGSVWATIPSAPIPPASTAPTIGENAAYYDPEHPDIILVPQGGRERVPEPDVGVPLLYAPSQPSLLRPGPAPPGVFVSVTHIPRSYMAPAPPYASAPSTSQW